MMMERVLSFVLEATGSFLLLLMGIGLMLLPFSLHFLSYLPYRRRKDQEALMKANAERREEVWPPAPTTFAAQEPEQESFDWVWCSRCQRVMNYDDLYLREAQCIYEDCAAPFENLLTWHSIIRKQDALPKKPERGVVYPNLVKVDDPARQESSAVREKQ